MSSRRRASRKDSPGVTVTHKHGSPAQGPGARGHRHRPGGRHSGGFARSHRGALLCGPPREIRACPRQPAGRARHVPHVGWRAAPDIPLQELPAPERQGGRGAQGHSAGLFLEVGGFVDTPVYDRYKLRPGMEIRGPAIVEERECTIVAGPSATMRIDPFGNLFMDLKDASEQAGEVRDADVEPA